MRLLAFCKVPEGLYAAAVAPWSAFAFERMTLITKPGWESMGTWLLATSCVVASMRLVVATISDYGKGSLIS